MHLLHQALEVDNDDQALWLLAHGADVNAPDDAGNTPLMLAMAYHADETIVRRLLRRGANLEGANHAGHTAWMRALDHSNQEGAQLLWERYRRLGQPPSLDPRQENGRFALLDALIRGDGPAARTALAAGADPEAVNAAGDTPLMLVCKAGRAEMVRLLLAHGADPRRTEAEGNGWTALHEAARAGQADCAQALLAHGAPVDARDRWGRTPLMGIAFSSSVETARVLLEHGADVHAEAADGVTALEQAAWLADEAVIRQLLQAGAGSRPVPLQRAFHACFVDNNRALAPLLRAAGVRIGLAEAILLEDRERVDALLRGGVEARELSRALCVASEHANEEVVRLLLAHGADPHATCDGSTPLHRAYHNLWQREGVFAALLEAGGDVNARDTHGETPFTTRRGWSMGERERLAWMQRMLAHGADVNVPDEEGRTALMDAAWSRESAIVRLLLANGAAVNAQDANGRTALHFAAHGGHARIARRLLAHGARADVPDRTGRTPRGVAEGWVGRPIVALLRSAGARA